MSKTNSRPIGIFDSGIGGLSVARRVMETSPKENVVYFGDSARVPYGSKSTETVRHYSRQAAAFLLSHDVKLIIVACNTASSVALQQMRAYSPVPVVGVIEPGAYQAVATTRSGRIGVIGTLGTIRSGAYQDELAGLRADAQVFAAACPLFVGFAEEGLSDHAATRLMASEYLQPLLESSIDTLILGCTHYPLISPSIESICGDHVQLIDPGLATAEAAHELLSERKELNASTQPPRYEFYLSDFPHKFVEIGERFLGKSIEGVHQVSLDSLERG